MLMAMYSTLAEKSSRLVQDRVGPNRAGKGGLLQPLADGLKLFAKEEFEPDTPNLFFFFRSRDCDDYCFDDKCCDPWGDRFHLFGKDDIILQTTVIDVTLLLYSH
jgi:NADH-quinone oxidoreductase subunit H